MAIAWITGASSGLGLHTAQALHSAGYTVLGGARSFAGNEGESTAGFRLALDVTDEASMDAFCEKALRMYGPPDVLINCAGVLTLGACEEYTVQELRQVMDTVFLGQAAMISRTLPLMRARKSGRIVNFSSINGLMGIPFQGAYTAAKHALEGYSESLSMEVKPFGIEVMLVEPGDHQSGSKTYRKFALASEKADSPYRSMFSEATAVIAHDEETGSDPARLGKKIVRVLKRKRLPLRLRVALPSQHLAAILHKILPGRLFEGIILSYYIRSGKKEAPL